MHFTRSFEKFANMWIGAKTKNVTIFGRDKRDYGETHVPTSSGVNVDVEKSCKKVMITEDGNKDCEPVDKERFRKVFLPSGKNKNGSTPLLATSTPIWFYIRSQKSQDTHSKLFGQFIPNVSKLPLCYSFGIIVILVFRH